MSSEARTSADVAGAPADVAAKVEQFLLGEKCTIAQKSPDGLTIWFVTRKTMLSWELEGAVTITPAAQGSHIELVLNTHHNRPTAMMDGVKNEKSAKKLTEKLTAAL
ncbi:hypothetical protein [Microbacterium sp. NPDC057650]|uniref:hypothetical protein n=1 Tax=unclassified Microbacterium TaxID=2609290 RepID=UPI00366D4C30